MKKTLLLGSILAVFISVNAWANGETEYMESYHPDVKIYKKAYVKTNHPTDYEKRPQTGKQKQQPDIRPYVSLKAKFLKVSSSASLESNEENKVDIDDDVMGGSIAIGGSFKLPEGFVRGELEFSKNGKAKGEEGSRTSPLKYEIETQSVMANVYYDIETGTRVMPYIGGGMGFVRIKGTEKQVNLNKETSMKDTHFAWQIGGGASLKVTQNLALDFGYRYVDYEHFKKHNMDYNQKAELESSAHEVYAGLRFMF